MNKKHIIKHTLAGVFACAIIGTNALPAATQLPTLFPAISASAASYADFNPVTGVLTLRGNVSKAAIQNYANNSKVKSVVAATGTTFPADCSGLFKNFLCTTMDLSKANVRSVTSMKEMFANCLYLTSINLNNWETGSCKDMNKMFYNCYVLKRVQFNAYMDTSKLTNMNAMFTRCYELESVNIEAFSSTANVTGMLGIFSGCKKLKRLDLSNFNTAKVTDMRMMFSLCSSLTSLDLSKFNTANVKNMSNMFNDCSSLTKLDLMSFNTANVTDMSYMFYNCRNLEKIYTSSGFKTDKVKISNDMFRYCYNIVGWQGTTYDPSWTAKESARWDIRPKFRGYFSVK